MELNPRELIVHTNNFEEACEVVEWFESFGFQRRALKPELYTQYPYIQVNDDNILTGSSATTWTERLMEYVEWKAIVAPEPDIDPISNEDFLKILKLV